MIGEVFEAVYLPENQAARVRGSLYVQSESFTSHFLSQLKDHFIILFQHLEEQGTSLKVEYPTSGKPNLFLLLIWNHCSYKYLKILTHLCLRKSLDFSELQFPPHESVLLSLFPSR